MWGGCQAHWLPREGLKPEAQWRAGRREGRPLLGDVVAPFVDKRGGCRGPPGASSSRVLDGSGAWGGPSEEWRPGSAGSAPKGGVGLRPHRGE
ncbi:hypothetical protein NDU88_006330 [Pleurodeles waltl]|uniref:Uncharacterized protein n=1 Tax=Pleurodeles waltl TaxID=8319 RepID=A0AAV7ULM0_PLEWA|nr:hypothetical protein NDU88_006330 [Pleurodeles waltl]